MGPGPEVALLALLSTKGSPGVTATTVALAAAWPAERDVAVAEVDPAGGDLAAAYGLSLHPGLTTLAATVGRPAEEPAGLSGHLQRLPGGLGVLLAPPSPPAVQGALSVVGHELRSLAMAAGLDCLADAGRLASGTEARPVDAVIAVADLVVVVSRCEVGMLAHVADRLPGLRALRADRADAGIVLVLVGDGPYSSAEVAETLRLPVAGRLGEDRAGAEIALGRRTGSLGRHPLFRDARALASALCAQAATAELRWRPPSVEPVSIAEAPW